MSSGSEMLKPTEAAVVASVPLRDVNRAIDEHILPKWFVSTSGGRFVAADACSLIEFYVSSAGRLTSEERLFAIREVGSRLYKFRSRPRRSMGVENWTVRHDFLTIDLTPFVLGARERMTRLMAARKMVVVDADLLGGTPVLRGTRVPVHDIAASVAAGVPMDRIRSAYPSLDREMVELAVVYAEANPPRGRPRTINALSSGATIVSERRVPRRRKIG